MEPLEAAELIKADYASSADRRVIDSVSALGIDACLIEHAKGPVLICQGSVGGIDWIRNLEFRPQAGEGDSGATWHRGMLGEQRVVWAVMKHYKPKWIIGHSRGGGIGQPLSVSFLARDPECRSIFFAAPRCLVTSHSIERASAWLEFVALSNRIQIFNLANDIVPRLPPFPRFKHFGQVTWLPAVRTMWSHGMRHYIKALTP
jgi:hypothetical protein